VGNGGFREGLLSCLNTCLIQPRCQHITLFEKIAGVMLRLRPLRPDDEQAARQAHAELAGDGFAFLLEDWDATLPWDDYLRRLDNARRGIDIPAGRVPATFLGAIAGGDLVGRVSIRHELNDYLLNFGGHIGYGVRPGFRRQGFATEILRQGLVIARAAGVDRILVTCDENNHASAAVIERNGGVLEDVRTDEADGVRRSRYWID
jgi:predicted acetyltransferase